MSTKTISLRLEAYDRLKRARRHPRESFSDVVLRAEWPDLGVTAGELLQWYAHRGPVLSERALDFIDRAKQEDSPPEDKWQTRD